MSLRQVAPYAADTFTDALLKALSAELAAVP